LVPFTTPGLAGESPARAWVDVFRCEDI
jgi:hypothetical protein